jgi:molybdopterin molybdotransferase
VRSVEEQLERVLGAGVRPAPVRLAITEAYGLRCAEEVVSARPVPGFDMAAIDGYAVRSVDVFGAGEVVPVQLPVVGEIPAGSRHPLRLQPGQAVRVGAGAPLPTLADAVVPVGYTDAGTARVSVTRSVPSAAFVRRLGEDVQPGDLAVRRDAVLGAAQVGLLAAAGRDKVLVHPRPRVSVISVGDELVELARTPGAGQVTDICSHALTAAAREAGADTSRAGLVRGDARQIASAVQDRLPFSDLLVVCGAVGGRAGAEVQAALDGLGELDTTRVAMHPGSTQGFGRLGPDNVPTFLFPSQPATALLLFEVFVRPLLRTIEGRRDVQRRTVSARLTSPVTSVKGRRGYLRGRLLREKASGDYLVQPLATSGIHLLSALADANCLIVLPEDATEVGLDEPVTVLHLPA